jgi:putative spermidine/putrescine transport system permease protein
VGALLTPTCLFVVLALLVPPGLLFRYSLNAFAPGQFMVEALTPASYVKFFTDPYYLAVLWRTVHIAALVTMICLILGFLLAYALAQT